MCECKPYSLLCPDCRWPMIVTETCPTCTQAIKVRCTCHDPLVGTESDEPEASAESTIVL
jgi:hypothetical protein